jgi:hypothetical protein
MLMSCGISMITGPGRPDCARVKARRNTSGTRSGDGTLNVHFAIVWKVSKYGTS